MMGFIFIWILMVFRISQTEYGYYEKKKIGERHRKNSREKMDWIERDFNPRHPIWWYICRRTVNLCVENIRMLGNSQKRITIWYKMKIMASENAPIVYCIVIILAVIDLMILAYMLGPEVGLVSTLIPMFAISIQTGQRVKGVVYAEDFAHGTVTGSTGATSGNWVQIITNQNFKVANYSRFEVRLRISDVSEADLFAGFYKDADEYANFKIDNADIKGETNNGGGGDSADTGVNASDNTYITLQIRLSNDFDGGGNTRTEYYVDNERKLNRLAVVTSDEMAIRIRLECTSNTDVSTTVDYIKAWQKRS